MKIIITEKQLDRIIHEQASSFQSYINELINSPTEFLNKLNSDSKFKQEYINSYRSNTEQNFELMGDAKNLYELKFHPLIANYKDLSEENPEMREMQIKNVNDYNNFKSFIKKSRQEGKRLTGLIQSNIKNLDGGRELSDALNIALGQDYF